MVDQAIRLPSGCHASKDLSWLVYQRSLVGEMRFVLASIERFVLVGEMMIPVASPLDRVPARAAEN